ncbi:hypothetical protein GCM10010532_108010 [Dactylosporangium siamense]
MAVAGQRHATTPTDQRQCPDAIRSYSGRPPVEVTIIITRHNVAELDDMRALIDAIGLPRHEYAELDEWPSRGRIRWC